MNENKLKKLLSKYALPLVYGFVVMKIILDSYFINNHYGIYLGFIAYECALFFIFEKLKPKKIIRGIAYIALGTVITFLSVFITMNANVDSNYGFLEWFYLSSLTVGEIMPYTMLLFWLLGFFIISIIYYFTIIRYRTIGLLAVTIFPFAIYGKRDDVLTTFDVTLMLTVFLALMVHARQVSDDKRDDNKGTLIINKAYLAAVALFVTVVGAATMLAPKPQIQSRLEQNKELFNFNVIKVQKTDYDDYTNQSSPRFGANATGEILFKFRCNAPLDVFYLRRQSFDVFRNNAWVNIKQYRLSNIGPELNEDERSYLYMPISMYNLTSEIANSDIDTDNGISKNFKDVTQNIGAKSYTLIEHSDSFGPNYVPAPINTMPSMISGVNAYLSYRGDIADYNNASHTLFANIIFYPETDEVYNAAKSAGMTWDKFSKTLYSAKNAGEISEELYSALMRQKQLYSAEPNCSDKVKELAHQITDKYESDYDKATALVKYFEDNGFVYDLDYEPDDESIDYFLFTSKRASCTSYATAMTLMARAVGLPARYVEGFACNEVDENGEYVVRDSCAHAYVEVLIPGLGWMSFDPTVPGYLDNIRKASEGNGINSSKLTVFLGYFSQLILLIAVIFIVVFVLLLDAITENIFRLSLKFTPIEKKAVKLYKRCLKLLELSSHERLKGLTPEELCEYAKVNRFVDLTPIINMFNAACFGGYVPSEDEFNTVYEYYKTLWKPLTKKPRIKT